MQVSTSELAEDASAAAAAGAGGAQPEVSIQVEADLGEAALFIGGRAPDTWWPPQVQHSPGVLTAGQQVRVRLAGAGNQTALHAAHSLDNLLLAAAACGDHCLPNCASRQQWSVAWQPVALQTVLLHAQDHQP